MLFGVLDLGIDLNLWPWVWLVVGAFFAALELTVLAGSFVLLPFAVSAFVAALLGFYDVSIEIQWAVFIGGGALLWIALYKRVMKFAGDNEMAPGVGADRLVGLTAIVTAEIDPDDTERKGRVKVQGEVWSALTDNERPVPAGSKVRIDEMSGTRVKVSPIPSSTSTSPPGTSPSGTSPSSTSPAGTSPSGTSPSSTSPPIAPPTAAPPTAPPPHAPPPSPPQGDTSRPDPAQRHHSHPPEAP